MEPTIALGFFAIVPLFLGLQMARSRGAKRLARALSVGLMIVPTALTLLQVMDTRPRPMNGQPFPDAAEYADAARQLAVLNGYVTYVHDDTPRPPRYPPGFSMALAPFVALGGEPPSGAQLGAKVFAACYVLATVLAAWSLGGTLAAALAATLIGLSPFAYRSAALIMSDALGAALTVVLVPLLCRRSREQATLAGLIAGSTVALRLSALVNVATLLLATPGKLRKRTLVAALPPIVALGVVQWRMFGSPFSTGYNYWLPGLRNFDGAYALAGEGIRDGALFPDALNGLLLSWVCPCPAGGPQAALPHILLYPAVLLGLFWVFSPPLATLPGMLHAWQRRRDPVGAFALWLTIISLVFYTFYYYQATRFMAAPATILTAFSAAWCAGLIERTAQRLRKQSSATLPEPLEV